MTRILHDKNVRQPPHYLEDVKRDPFHTHATYTGGGHGFAYYNRMTPAAINFLVERLQAELRRVV